MTTQYVHKIGYLSFYIFGQRSLFQFLVKICVVLFLPAPILFFLTVDVRPASDILLSRLHLLYTVQLAEQHFVL